jgi:hypothetical protein
MYVARDQQTDGSVSPETRSAFYELLCDELLASRRFRREAYAVGRIRLKQQRQALLGEVCLGHILSSEETQNSIPLSRFIAAAQRQQFGDGSDVAITDLSVDTGLFVQEKEGETLRFLHVTLCEFLAAWEVVERGDAGWLSILHALDTVDQHGELIQARESRLTDVIAFACGLAARVTQDRMLNDLHSRGARDILLKAAAECQRFESTVFQESIKHVAREVLLTTPKNWNVDWQYKFRLLVSLLRESGSGILDPEAARQALNGSSFVQELIVRYGGQSRLLASLAHFDVTTAIEMAEATSSLAPERMRILAAEADDFTVLEAILTRCEAGVPGWAEALLEHALADGRVAHLLLTTTAGKQPAAMPKRHTWAKSFITRGSMYGWLLDNIRLEGPWNDDVRSVLKTIVRIRPPRRRALVRLRQSLPTLIVLTLAVISLAFVYRFAVSANQDQALVSAVILLAVGILFAGIGVLLRAIVGDFRKPVRSGQTLAPKQKAEPGAMIDVDVNARPGSLTWREDVLLDVLNLRFGEKLTAKEDWRLGLQEITAAALGVRRAESTSLTSVRRFRVKRHLKAQPQGASAQLGLARERA